MIGRLAVAAALVAALLRTAPAVAQTGVKVPLLRSQMVVSTDWLADHMNDPSIVVLHVADKRSDYDAGHIPGAHFLAVDDVAVTRRRLKFELPSPAELAKLFGGLGVGDDARVVLYDERGGLLAARAYWTLDYLGHGDRAALLDGGLEKWRSEERPVTPVVRPIRPARFTPKVNRKVLAQLADIRRYSRANANQPSSVALIDARPAEEYAGKTKVEMLARGGHIPGATNLYWQQLIESKDNPQLKPVPDMRRILAAAGATPGKKVVTYCRTGVQAAFVYFVAKYLGYDAALYDGSAQEWNNASGTRVDER